MILQFPISRFLLTLARFLANDCGVVKKKHFFYMHMRRQFNRIVNGTDVGSDKYPWFAVLQITGDGGIYECGGSLITSQHVISAAHCFNKQ